MSVSTQKPLTGWHVLFIVAGFFGVILAVNIYFTVMAVRSFPGEDVPRSYRQGLEYNHTINNRRAQQAFGWQVSVNTHRNDLIIKLTNANSDPIDDLEIAAKLRHPTDTARDRVIVFEGQGGGRYVASNGAHSGKWLLVADARNQTHTFHFEYELWP